MGFNYRGDKNESLFFRFIKNGADERWISLFDALYSPTGIDEILFSPTNISVMTLLGNGRVGIGTSTPSSTLEVNGTVTLNTTSLVPLLFIENTTSILCNSTNAGGIIYSSGKHYGCDGINWNAFF